MSIPAYYAPVPRAELVEARAADIRARDRIAVAIDELLPGAPLMRMIGARLLVRPLSRSSSSTAVAIAREFHVNNRTLRSRIQRAGGSSIKLFRQEIIMARLAAIVECSRIAWPFAAEILGAPRTHQLLGIVRRRGNLPPGLWRKRVTADAQLQRLQLFLAANAAAWSELPPPAQIRWAMNPAPEIGLCARCGAPISQERPHGARLRDGEEAKGRVDSSKAGASA
jgi:hypothetical protein